MIEETTTERKPASIRRTPTFLILILLGFALGFSTSLYLTTRRPPKDIESLIKAVITASSPSVFSIHASQATAHSGTSIKREKTGSGVIFKQKDNQAYLITNSHVIEHANEIKVVDSDKNEIQAELVGSDPLKDIAVLRFKADRQMDIPSFSDQLVEPGAFVVALGSPFQFDQSATFGIVSANQRTLRTNFGYQISGVIQTDASINPGNSGGPLLNLDGKVVGINTAIFSTSQGFEGLGFAIPSSETKRIALKIIEEGELAKKVFGITCADFDKSVANSFHLPVDGVLLLCLDPNSSLGKAGLRPTRGVFGADGFIMGDIIVELNGREVRSMNELTEELTRSKGKKATLTIFRDGEFHNITMEPHPDMKSGWSSAKADKSALIPKRTSSKNLARLMRRARFFDLTIRPVKP